MKQILAVIGLGELALVICAFGLVEPVFATHCCQYNCVPNPVCTASSQCDQGCSGENGCGDGDTTPAEPTPLIFVTGGNSPAVEGQIVECYTTRPCIDNPSTGDVCSQPNCVTGQPVDECNQCGGFGNPIVVQVANYTCPVCCPDPCIH